jgi:hypothetical protein
MEAATSPDSPLLSRDGALPMAPAAPGSSGSPTEPIDGVALCCCCGRFPLVGEHVVRREGRKRSGWVCERCETAEAGERIGPVGERARVRSFGGAMNVRRAGGQPKSRS